MGTAQFRFYEELNDFLPPERRKVAFEHRFRKRASIKDMIESLGVPHTEIDLILANGESVDFSYQPADGDRISVYPVFECLDIAKLTRLRPAPLREPKFIVDVNLGRLARHLRLLGFDASYDNALDDRTVARISRDERRILLTRDRRLLHHKIVTHGYFVRATDPRMQAVEVLRRLDLAGRIDPFTRCPQCNGVLEDVAKARVLDRLPPMTRREQEHFRQCAECGQIYWPGSHYQGLRRWIDDVVAAARAGGMV